MPEYELRCEVPYELDDGESFGQHDICWSADQVRFAAENDQAAREAVAHFLQEGSITVGGETAFRKETELLRIVPKSEGDSDSYGIGYAEHLIKHLTEIAKRDKDHAVSPNDLLDIAKCLQTMVDACRR